MNRAGAYRAGLRAEAAAAWMLRLRGWRILARRFRTPVGEIDIIAQRGAVIAFVEVKRRRARRDAMEALRPAQRERMIRAARWWQTSHSFAQEAVLRFDLVTVNRWMWPRHMPDIFGEDSTGGW